MATSYKTKIYTTLGTPTNITTTLTPLSVSNSSGVPVKDYTVKGKSIVWNQLVKNGNFVDKTGWSVYNGTGSVSNNKYTFTVTGTQTYSFIMQYMDKSLFIVGHKYYITATITPQYSAGRLTVALHNGVDKQPEAWTAPASSGKTNFVSTIFTPLGKFVSGAANLVRFILYCPHTQSAQGDVTEISNVWMVDLTKMFGAGNEPTAAQFRAMFPDDYYEYDAGTIKNISNGRLEATNATQSYKSVNIPVETYFPDGFNSVGNVYDEISFSGQTATRRIGVRSYQDGDENESSVLTDKTNTLYVLSTPIITNIPQKLQALPTYKGFTSFSFPNSLTQSGPFDLTYYAEGGASPESGWLATYKRKIYTGKTVEWNQWADFGTLYGQGGYLDGIHLFKSTDKIYAGHKYYLYAKTEITNSNGGVNVYYKPADSAAFLGDNINRPFFTPLADAVGGGFDKGCFWIYLYYTKSATDIMLFDLTKMFGTGNEPSTPAEFWQYFDHKYYPYNTGETQPLFKISRKRRWGSATPASLYVGEMS